MPSLSVAVAVSVKFAGAVGVPDDEIVTLGGVLGGGADVTPAAEEDATEYGVLAADSSQLEPHVSGHVPDQVTAPD